MDRNLSNVISAWIVNYSYQFFFLKISIYGDNNGKCVSVGFGHKLSKCSGPEDAALHLVFPQTLIALLCPLMGFVPDT